MNMWGTTEYIMGQAAVQHTLVPTATGKINRQLGDLSEASKKHKKVHLLGTLGGSTRLTLRA